MNPEERTSDKPGPRGSSWSEKSWTSCAGQALADKVQPLPSRRARARARIRREFRSVTPSPCGNVEPGAPCLQA